MSNQEVMFTGQIARPKIYPLVLSSKQINGIYKRERTWWGRLFNDIDHYLKRSLM